MLILMIMLKVTIHGCAFHSYSLHGVFLFQENWNRGRVSCLQI